MNTKNQFRAALLVSGLLLSTFTARADGTAPENSPDEMALQPLAEVPLAEVSASSRFGLNVSRVEMAPRHRRLGIGWVRFENMKWPMMSPAPDVVRFDGSVAPWNVQHDAIIAAYRAAGLNVLPFLFQTPLYASSAPAEVADDRKMSYPPRDNAAFAEFVFQTVARYGAKKHPPEVLQSQDKKSGLDQIHVWEIWNEPNLQAPSWGPWVGTTEQYLEMFRPAAEAAKRADPAALVTNGGYAGIAVETVDPLRRHTYADGRHPLDFVDVLNVHFYSGQTPPERATVDPNVNRSGATEGVRTYEDDLQRLARWRDENKPGMPIWLTETGFDTAGPYSVGERLQAARLPRVIMLALANGIEKVFVYRESGSAPGQHAASGLERDDGTLKPAWQSYGTLIRQLDGTDDGRRLPYPDPNVRLYAWRRGDETILSAWTIEGESTLKLALGRALVTDGFGHATTRVVNGDLPLSDVPLYIRDIENRAAVTALVEQSRAEAAAVRAERETATKLRTYLFDFGGRDHVGILDLGRLRAFTTVLKTDVFEAARGYGFAPNAAGQDDDRHWIEDPLERDSTRITPGQQFRFKVAPGRYRLRIGIASVGAKDTLTLTGAGEPKLLEYDRETPPLEADIEVGDEPLAIEVAGYADLKWLSLVEQ